MNEMASAGSLAAEFIEKVARRDCVVGVIGLGYVGLPLVLGFHDLGFRLIGFDVDRKKVDKLMRGESYIGHIGADRIGEMVDTGRFEATDDVSRLGQADAILICVPTPLTRHREPDVSYIVSTAELIAPHLREGQVIILESTTYPGTTREILQPLLEEGSGLGANTEFFVAYSPEREDPGNPTHGATSIPKVVGAETRDGLDMASSLYETLVPKVVRVSSPDTAEAVKLSENIFRAVNIALANELKVIYGAMGIDVWEVIDAAKTKPFGYMAFYPGPGLGGHCIPIDPFYLTWKAREQDMNTRFIELAGEINANMPKHVIAALAEALSRHKKLALNGAKVLVVGLAYKKNVDDLRESATFTLMELLKERGARIDYHDPYIPVIHRTREHPQFTGLKSVAWTSSNLADYDAVLISTDHDNIDWQMLVDNASLIVDTRNALAEWHASHSDKIVKA